MKFQKINIDGKNIAVYKKGVGEKTILFVHGNSLNALSFEKQFNANLSDNYQLITFDLPGHGNSDKAENPSETYNLLSYSSLLNQLITRLELSNYILIGHSLGGHIVLEAASMLDEQLKGLLIFGAPPLSIPPDMANAFKPNPNMGYAFQGELTDKEAETLANEFILETTPDLYINSIQNTDPNARALMAASIGEGKMKDELEILKILSVPIAILHAEKDALVQLDYFSKLDIPTLWKGAIQIIKNSGHSPQWEQSENTNNLIKAFIADASK